MNVTGLMAAAIAILTTSLQQIVSSTFCNLQLLEGREYFE
jgi:hypothetical protein